jgi:hypothetical protein
LRRHKPPHDASITTCAIAYTFYVDGRTLPSAGCAANILPSPPRLTARLGERFSVQILHEASGRLDVPLPEPATPAVKLLDHSGSTARYDASSVVNPDKLAHLGPIRDYVSLLRSRRPVD